MKLFNNKDTTMQYDTIPLQKAVQCPHGHIFNIDQTLGVGRCPDPTCTCLVKSAIKSILHFRTHDDIVLAAVGNIKRYLIITPNTLTRIHLGSRVIADSDILYELFEAPTTTDDGNVMKIINIDRNDATISILQIFLDPTVTIDGDCIRCRRNPVGIFSPNLVREIDPESEFILRQNTKYQFKVTALIKATNASIGLNWLEI